ncbi:MAG: ketopantoate reductase C-terminal domain-containing protein [Pseudomonadota bacterium]
MGSELLPNDCVTVGHSVDALDGDATMTEFFDAVDATEALDVTRVPDGDTIVWQKFTAQASIAGITALTRLPLGGVFASTEAEILLRQMFEEALEVAAAKGITLAPDHLDTSLNLYKQQPGAQSSSLLVDIEAGKPTELEWLSGRVHALGLELGVPTPAHSAAWLALAAFKDGPPTIRN